MSSDTHESTLTGLSMTYLVIPSLGVLSGALPIFYLRVGLVPWWMSNLPFWIGLVSAPGYVYAWSERWRKPNIGKVERLFIHASLAGALLASTWGSMLMLLTVVFWIFPALSVVLTVRLWMIWWRGSHSA
jgi:hypothetical protein